MAGRVTRRKRRAANAEWHEWVLMCSTAPGECDDVRHEKWVANWYGRTLIFGPFDGVSMADCGCEFRMIPACQL